MSTPNPQTVTQPRPLPKVLRIGIVQEGRIVAERLMKVGEVVTVGSAPKNTFEITGEGIPPKLELFSPKGSSYLLTVNEGVGGKIQWKDGVRDIEDLRQNESQKKGDLYQISITEDTKGKVVIGNSTILFQFVPAPPEPLKVAAPVDVKGGWLDEDDPLFLGLLMVFSFFAGIFSLWVHLSPIPEEDPLAMIDSAADLVVETIALPPPPAETEAPTEDGSKATKTETKVAKAGEAQPKASAPADASRTSVAQRSLLIQAIGGEAGAGAGLAADLLGDDAASMANLSQALAGASGVASATAANVGGVRGGGTGGPADARVEVGSAGGGGNGLGTTGAAVVRRARVQDDGGEVDAEEGDAGGVAGIIKRNSGRITACTETALKSNPNVKGRVSVTWRIEQGRVVGAQVVGNQTGDAGLSDCVLRAVRSFRFDASVTATVDQYTWIVSAQ